MKILANLNDRFPKYYIGVKWIQDIPPRDPESNYQHKQVPELPLGRMYNGTSYYTMFKKQKDEISQQKYVNDWWDKYKKTDYELVSLEIKFIEIETWCLGWFGHWTFDIGKTDQDILQSFREYVERKIDLNEQARREGKDYEPWCLMGAEDEWRWYGQTNEDSAPCRCGGCKKSGIIRISH